MSTSSTTHLKLFDSGGWVLPWQVADESGFFTAEGISVEFVEGDRSEQALLDILPVPKSREFFPLHIAIACE